MVKRKHDWSELKIYCPNCAGKKSIGTAKTTYSCVAEHGIPSEMGQRYWCQACDMIFVIGDMYEREEEIAVVVAPTLDTTLGRKVREDGTEDE